MVIAANEKSIPNFKSLKAPFVIKSLFYDLRIHLRHPAHRKRNIVNKTKPKTALFEQQIPVGVSFLNEFYCHLF